jgi:hypothetical protein
MAKQFIVSAGDRSITTTKTGINSSIDTLLKEGFVSISVKCTPIKHQPFKVGDVVEVIDNKSYHGFCLGEQVTVTSNAEHDLRCSNGIKEWWMQLDEIRLVK